MSYWQDKVVLVTGGTSGLGMILARHFLAAGARVVVTGLKDEFFDQVEAKLSEYGKVVAIAADITQQDQVDALFSQVFEQFDRLDALINCAGRSGRKAILDTTPEDFQSMLDLNFTAAVRCTRAATPHLLKSKGHIVNIGSLASKSATKYLGAYPVSKHAIAAYSLQLRMELAPEGLHVLLVCPGPMQRDDSGSRYDAEVAALPASASRPGGGVSLKGVNRDHLAKEILTACERRHPELVIPRRARVQFAIAQLFPRLGDWILRRMTK